MAESFPTRYAHAAIRYRWWFLVFAVVVLLLTASGASKVVLDDNYRSFFSDDNPHLLALNALEETYAKEEVILFVMAPENEQVFTKENLEAVQWLTTEAWQLTYGTRVDSITSYQHSYAEGDDIIIEDLVPEDRELTPEAIAKIRETALNEPSLVSRIISPKGHVTAVAATLVLPGLDAGERVMPIQDARDLEARFETKYPTIDLRLTGGAVLSMMFTEYTQSDMGLLTPLMYVLIFLTTAIILRSLWATLAAILVILFSVASAMGLAGWFGLHITAPSSAMPTIVMTLAVADCVHILTAFLAKARSGSSRIDAIIHSLKLNFTATAITSCTTALGLLTTLFSDVPPLEEYGMMTAMGVGMAWFYSIVLLPPLVTLLPAPKLRSYTENDGFFERLGTVVAARKREILALSAIFVVICGMGLYGIDFKNNWINWFKPHTQFRQDVDFTTKNLSGINALEFSIPANGPNGITDPEYLEALDAFAQWARHQPYVNHVSTLTDTMRRLNQNMHGDDPAYYVIPESAELAAQYLLLYEMSLPYGQDLNNQINLDKSATRLLVITEDKNSSLINALKLDCETWLQENAPDYMVTQATGNGVMFASIAERTIRSIALTTPIALVTICLILVVLFRSIKYGLICLIPNLVPIIIAFGIWGYLFGRINFGVACVAGLAIGIVVDDTVHFMTKYLRARREENLSPELAVRYALTTVGPALVTTSLVLILGFSVMLLSAFNFNAHMGLLSAIAIGTALISDLFLLPAALLVIDRDPVTKP